jgi:hypothetical protein
MAGNVYRRPIYAILCIPLSYVLAIVDSFEVPPVLLGVDTLSRALECLPFCQACLAIVSRVRIVRLCACVVIRIDV